MRVVSWWSYAVTYPIGYSIRGDSALAHDAGGLKYALSTHTKLLGVSMFVCRMEAQQICCNHEALVVLRNSNLRCSMLKVRGGLNPFLVL